MTARGRTAACLLAASALLAVPACSDDGADRGGPTPTPATSAPSLPTASTSTTTPQPSASQATPRPDGLVRIIAVEVASEDRSPGGQYVMLFNGTSEAVDLACWTVRSASTGISARISTDGAIPPGAAARLFPDGRLFGSTDTVKLSDRDAREVDHTPRITDRTGDDQVWFRDQTGGWRFGRGLAIPSQVADGRLALRSTSC
ncbi:lamin tail domain-containing protein [Kribbella antiqua]|nr:lamin tail domain-containing protein [Kribbella antiqua]